jgi:hypothetical protein
MVMVLNSYLSANKGVILRLLARQMEIDRIVKKGENSKDLKKLVKAQKTDLANLREPIFRVIGIFKNYSGRGRNLDDANTQILNMVLALEPQLDNILVSLENQFRFLSEKDFERFMMEYASMEGMLSATSTMTTVIKDMARPLIKDRKELLKKQKLKGVSDFCLSNLMKRGLSIPSLSLLGLFLGVVLLVCHHNATNPTFEELAASRVTVNQANSPKEARVILATANTVYTQYKKLMLQKGEYTQTLLDKVVVLRNNLGEKLEKLKTLQNCPEKENARKMIFSMTMDVNKTITSIDSALH